MELVTDETKVVDINCNGRCFKQENYEWKKELPNCSCLLKPCQLNICERKHPEFFLDEKGICKDCANLMENDNKENSLIPKELTVEEKNLKRYESCLKELRANFNEKQKYAFQCFLNKQTIFMSGHPGTGKTHVLKAMILDCYLRGKESKLGITATTGIAANNIRDQLSTIVPNIVCSTIHSWSAIGVIKGFTTVHQIMHNINSKRKRHLERIKKCDILILEEISMLNAYYFELLDQILRDIKSEMEKPFGGIQLILCGDFAQLPAINKDLNGLPYEYSQWEFCFETNIWKKLFSESDNNNNNNKAEVIFFDEIYRQKDEQFQDILLKCRYVDTHLPLHSDVINFVKERRVNQEEMRKKEAILIAPLNQTIDLENEHHLRKFGDVESYDYFYKTEGVKINQKEKSEIEAIYSEADKWDENLIVKGLCVGCKVIVTQNIYRENEKDLVNGLRGVISRFIRNEADSDDMFFCEFLPVVKFSNFESIIQPACRYYDFLNSGKSPSDDDWKGIRLTYLPLKVAAAFTIHKSQGSQFDTEVVLDLGPKNFSAGGAYCAFSRAKNKEKVFVLDFAISAFKTHRKVIDFYKQYDPYLQKLLDENTDHGKKYKANMLEEDLESEKRKKK